MADIGFNALAEVEYEQALEWYRERDEPTARRFAAEFQRALDTLAALPEIGAPCDDRYRYWALGRFSFGIVYYFDGSVVRVVAVPHHRQRPGFWADRL